MEINKRLKARIIEIHGSQTDFADELGVAESVVSRIVRGRRELSPEMKKAWAARLDCKVKDIFGGKG
jgi:transcriptional regulator with XRE-family HTH domain